MKRVLVTHADEPLGRRVVKRLFHDDRIDTLFAPRSKDKKKSRKKKLKGKSNKPVARKTII